MRPPKNTSFVSLLFLVMLGPGFGDDGGPGNPDRGAGDSGVADGRTVDSGGDAGMEPAGPGLAGTLADEAGEPLRFEMVLACMTTACLFGGSEGDGRTISEIEGHLSDPTPGRATGTVVKTDPSAGITELTWLVIAR